MRNVLGASFLAIFLLFSVSVSGKSISVDNPLVIESVQSAYMLFEQRNFLSRHDEAISRQLQGSGVETEGSSSKSVLPICDLNRPPKGYKYALDNMPVYGLHRLSAEEWSPNLHWTDGSMLQHAEENTKVPMYCYVAEDDLGHAYESGYDLNLNEVSPFEPLMLLPYVGEYVDFKISGEVKFASSVAHDAGFLALEVWEKCYGHYNQIASESPALKVGANRIAVNADASAGCSTFLLFRMLKVPSKYRKFNYIQLYSSEIGY